MVATHAIDQDTSHVLSGDDVEIASAHVRVEIGTTSIRASLIVRVEVGRYKGRACGSSVVGIKLCR